MSNVHWRLVINGKAAGDNALRAAVLAMRKRGIVLDVRVTWEAGDAERHVSRAIHDGVDIIVAVGGDGTLSAVAMTLAHRNESADALPSLGLVPMGTANDFATAAGLPAHPLEALALVHECAAVPIDLLRLDVDGVSHWAANVATGGFGTQVTVGTTDGLKKAIGGLAYLVTGMSRIGRIGPVTARIGGPGFAWDGPFIALAIGNGRQAGDGHVLCPDARIDDGLLELTIVPELDGEVAVLLGALVTDGPAAALDRVATRARLSRIEIESPEPFVLSLDGEPVVSTRFHIECVPRRLRMHLPPDCALLSTHS